MKHDWVFFYSHHNCSSTKKNWLSSKTLSWVFDFNAVLESWKIKTKPTSGNNEKIKCCTHIFFSQEFIYVFLFWITCGFLNNSTLLLDLLQILFLTVAYCLRKLRCHHVINYFSRKKYKFLSFCVLHIFYKCTSAYRIKYFMMINQQSSPFLERVNAKNIV